MNWLNNKLPKGSKSGVLEIVSIYCPTCDTHHDSE